MNKCKKIAKLFFYLLIIVTIFTPVNAKQKSSTKKIKFKAYELSDKTVLRITNKNTNNVYIDLTIYYYNGKKLVDMQDNYCIPLKKNGGINFTEFYMDKNKYDNFGVKYYITDTSDDFNTKKIKITDTSKNDNEYLFRVFNHCKSERSVTIHIVYYRKGKVVGFDYSNNIIRPNDDAAFHLLEPYNSKNYKNIKYDNYKLFISSAKM